MTEETRRNLTDIWNQFDTIARTLEHIDNGEAIAAIHFTDDDDPLEMDTIFNDPNYIEKMAADLASYQIELAQEMIAELQKIVDTDTAAVTSEDVEPFPIGTPKADHRRGTIDTDDGK